MKEVLIHFSYNGIWTVQECLSFLFIMLHPYTTTINNNIITLTDSISKFQWYSCNRDDLWDHRVTSQRHRLGKRTIAQAIHFAGTATDEQAQLFRSASPEQKGKDHIGRLRIDLVCIERTMQLLLRDFPSIRQDHVGDRVRRMHTGPIRNDRGTPQEQRRWRPYRPILLYCARLHPLQPGQRAPNQLWRAAMAGDLVIETGEIISGQGVSISGQSPAHIDGHETVATARMRQIPTRDHIVE